MPDFVGAGNPVDLTAQAITHLDMYAKTIEPLLAEERYGSLVLQAIVSSASEYALTKGRASLKPLLGAKKPVIYAMLGDEAEVPEKLVTELRGGNVPFFRSPERAFRALAKITAYGRAIEAAKTRSNSLDRRPRESGHRGRQRDVPPAYAGMTKGKEVA